jgi:hypothetical protein
VATPSKQDGPSKFQTRHKDNIMPRGLLISLWNSQNL